MKNLTDQQNQGNHDFQVGDLVVHVSADASSALLTVIGYQPNDHYWLMWDYLLHKSQIQHATTAEINAKRRLTATEQAIGEVS